MIPRFLFSYEQLISQINHADCLIVGGGIAGLYTALTLDRSLRVILITKQGIEESNTYRAQGGLAAVLSAQDSPLLHYDDTCLAGAGICEPRSVDILVREGPLRVRDLMKYGVRFDEKDGQIALTREGAHSQRRILHANGDATGAEIIRGLVAEARQRNNITILEHAYTLDIQTEDGACTGLYVLMPQGEIHFIKSKRIVLATGGLGQLFQYTTNPEVATGDGIAMALRAGAQLQDMEFIQFHPTVLTLAGAPCFLISEAVRGEGAVLRNHLGERFMPQAHKLAELAPRDIVSRAILEELERTKQPCVYLDITHEPEEKLRTRFPTIFHTLQHYGLDMSKDWIPVAPAAHYVMGGVYTDEHGQTPITGLYACGETASTGVHGANRLASNSLTEALVFGYRIAQHIAQYTLNQAQVEIHTDTQNHIQVGTPHSGAHIDKEFFLTPSGNEEQHMVTEVTEKIQELKQAMQRFAGAYRDESSLRALYDQLLASLRESLKRHREIDHKRRSIHSQEVMWFNMLMCSLLITMSARIRQESRGGHFRLDFPQQDDEHYLCHTVLYRDPEIGTIKESWRDVERR